MLFLVLESMCERRERRDAGGSAPLKNGVGVLDLDLRVSTGQDFTVCCKATLSILHMRRLARNQVLI